MSNGSVRRPPPWSDPSTGITYIGDSTRRAEPKPEPPRSGGGGNDPPSGPTPAERKFAAKRHNEGVKVFATWMNTVSGVAIGAAAIIPAVRGLEAFVREYQPVWFFVGLALHFVGQAALRFEMRSEE